MSPLSTVLASLNCIGFHFLGEAPRQENGIIPEEEWGWHMPSTTRPAWEVHGTPTPKDIKTRFWWGKLSSNRCKNAQAASTPFSLIRFDAGRRENTIILEPNTLRRGASGRPPRAGEQKKLTIKSLKSRQKMKTSAQKNRFLASKKRCGRVVGKWTPPPKKLDGSPSWHAHEGEVGHRSLVALGKSKKKSPSGPTWAHFFWVPKNQPTSWQRIFFFFSKKSASMFITHPLLLLQVKLLHSLNSFKLILPGLNGPNNYNFYLSINSIIFFMTALKFWNK